MSLQTRLRYSLERALQSLLRWPDTLQSQCTGSFFTAQVERESGRREEGGRRTAARRGEQLSVEEPRSGPGLFATETLEARYEDGISR